MWGLDVRLDPDGGYRWQLWASDGRKSALSHGTFRARFNAHRAADAFRDRARDLTYDVRQEGPGEYRWVASGAEGVLAVSAMVFADAEAAEAAADLIRRRAATAILSS